ncbi:MAG TPA: hypothetical protein ENI37_06580 [Chloroflexi bacterium]|nr:hypothetical protein [Chloroflexota bacterium]
MPKPTTQPTQPVETARRAAAQNPGLPSLPPGWVWTMLGEVCRPPQYGWTTKAVSVGDLKLLRTTDITSGYIDWHSVPYCAELPPDIEKYLLHDGDIVISRAGSVGYSMLIQKPPRAVFASYLIRFKPIYPWIEGRYLYYFLQSPHYWRAISEQTLGIAIPNVNAKKLRSISLPLAPLPEQRRIVARIEELFSQLDAAEEGLRRVQRNLKRYRAAVLKAAVEGRLVPTEAELARRRGGRGRSQTCPYETGAELLQRILAERRRRWEEREWAKLVEKAKKKAAQARRKAQGLPARIRDIPPKEWQAIPEEEYRRYLPKDDRWKQKYKEPAPPDTTDLPPLPEGWVWATVEMVGEVKGGKRVPKGHSYADGPTPYPYIRVTDFVDGTVRIEDLKYLKPETFEKIRKYTISSKDVFISIAGTIGVTGTVPEFLDGANLTENAAKITSLHGILPRYLHFVLSSPYGQGQISSRIISTNQPKLALFRIATIPIPLPSLAEQHRIVAEIERRLSVAREAEKAAEANLKRIARSRQAILKQAFEGKLVPQDPNDEPAEALLERTQRTRPQSVSKSRPAVRGDVDAAQQLSLFEDGEDTL